MDILCKVTAQNVIDRANQLIAQLKIKPRREKYRDIVLAEAEQHFLDEYQVKQLAWHLGIDYFSPPRNARGWSPSICKIYKSIKYTNPRNLKEFIVMISSKSLFGVRGVVHHTPEGYLDASWFTTFVPYLT